MSMFSSVSSVRRWPRERDVKYDLQNTFILHNFKQIALAQDDKCQDIIYVTISLMRKPF